MIDFLKYLRIKNKDRSVEWTNNEGMDILYAANELGGEVGEVLNKVKKLVREERGWRGSRTTVEALTEEIADVLICLDHVASHYSIDIAEAVIVKFNKTSESNGLQTKMESPEHKQPCSDIVEGLRLLEKICRDTEEACYAKKEMEITFSPTLVSAGICITSVFRYQRQPHKQKYVIAWANIAANRQLYFQCSLDNLIDKFRAHKVRNP